MPRVLIKREPLTPAQAALAARWWPYALKVALGMRRDRPGDYEAMVDAATDAVMNAARGYRGDRGATFKTFLVKVVRHAVIRHRLARPRHRLYPTAVPLGPRGAGRPRRAYFLPQIVPLWPCCPALASPFRLQDLTLDWPTRADIREAMRKALRQRERLVLLARIRGRTLGQVGKRIKRTKELVRQIERGARTRLARYLHYHGFPAVPLPPGPYDWSPPPCSPPS